MVDWLIWNQNEVSFELLTSAIKIQLNYWISRLNQTNQARLQQLQRQLKLYPEIELVDCLIWFLVLERKPNKQQAISKTNSIHAILIPAQFNFCFLEINPIQFNAPKHSWIGIDESKKLNGRNGMVILAGTGFKY